MLNRLRRLSKRKKIIIGLLLITILAAVAFFYLTKDGEDIVTQITEPDKKYYSRLTGEEITKNQLDEPIFAVMVENSEEARPQAGLNSAGIVFETVSEGGITRYLALFHENKPEEIGPVRSLRPAFVDWAAGFDVAIAHVGGSQPALDMVDDLGIKSLNQFFNDGPYYRRSDRVSPHNMYLRVADFVTLQEEKELDEAEFPDLKFEDNETLVDTAISAININFSLPLFNVVFNYDASQKRYLRELAGSPHIDANTNEQISVKNLIVIKEDIQSGAVGQGSAEYYSNGTVQQINWQQLDYKDRIKFTDLSGNELTMSRGNIWIAVVPSGGSVTAQ